MSNFYETPEGLTVALDKLRADALVLERLIKITIDNEIRPVVRAAYEQELQKLLDDIHYVEEPLRAGVLNIITRLND